MAGRLLPKPGMVSVTLGKSAGVGVKGAEKMTTQKRLTKEQYERKSELDYNVREQAYRKKTGVVTGYFEDKEGNLHPTEFYPKQPRKARSLGKHYRTSSETSLQMAQHPIPARTRQVLDYMLGKSHYQNLVDIRQKELAEKLGMKRNNVARAIAWLIKRHYIAAPPEFGEKWKPGQPKTYLLNPYRFAKGDDRENAQLQKAYPDLNIPIEAEAISTTNIEIRPNPKLPKS